MKCRYIYTITLFILVSVLCCGCSSESEGAVKIAAVIVFVVLFLGTSLISAMLTYRIKRKKYNDNNREKE